MAALLKRKKKTFERVAPAPPPGSKRDFKKELSRAAAEKKGERAELDTMPTATKESARAGEKRKAVETKPGPEAEEKEEDTYTSRLLAAKKRARKTGDE
jgi:hypothetical protein